MAAAGDSDDASDIFWPGYVDAISNLAINLLFVIAVMSIVVISATLQIIELQKKKDRAQADDTTFSVMETKSNLQGSGKVDAQSSTNAESQALKSFSAGALEQKKPDPNTAVGEQRSSAGSAASRSSTQTPTTATPASQSSQSQQTAQAQAQAQSQAQQQAKLEQQVKQQSEQIKQQSEQIKQQSEQIKQLQAQLDKAKAAEKTNAASGKTERKLEGVPGLDDKAGRVETVNANTPNPTPNGKNASKLLDGALVVQFGPDITQLSDAEAKEVVEKLKSFGSVDANGRWKLVVVVPAGFSEASRLGFYRANVVRNVLMKQGVQPGNIDVRLLESQRDTADSARVIVKPM